MSKEEMVKKLPGMWDWIIVTVVLMAVIAVVSPQHLSLVVFKLALVSIGTAITPWVFMRLYRRQTDQGFLRGEQRDPNGTIARAVVFAAIIVGLTLGA